MSVRHRHPRVRRGTSSSLLVVAGFALLGCGGNGPAGPDGSSAFAGTYATHVTLGENSCGAVTVQDNPTVVTYAEATRAVTFRHAGTTYAGTVAADSTFATQPRQLTGGDGFDYTITLAGRFRTDAFDADATVDRSASGQTCRYVVHWAGTR